MIVGQDAPYGRPLDSEPRIRNYNDLADAIVDRIKLAAVHQLPAEFFELLQPSQQQRQALYVKSGGNYAEVRTTVQSDRVDVEFWFNGNPVGVFRFAPGVTPTT
jgi:hypothetical protein